MKRSKAIYFFLLFLLFPFHLLVTEDFSLVSSHSLFFVEPLDNEFFLKGEIAKNDLIARELQQEHPDRKIQDQENNKRENLPDHIEKDDFESDQKIAPVTSKEAEYIYHHYYPKVIKRSCDRKSLALLLKVAALWHYQAQHRHKVLKIYKAYLKCYPSHQDVLFKLAQVEFWLSNNKKAEQILTKLCSLYPTNTDGAALLVKVFVARQKWKRAQKLLDGYPQLPDMDRERAIVALGLKNYACARSYYQKALEKEPNDANLMRGLAGVYMAQKQFKAAKPYYQKITKQNPKDQRYWNEYAYLRSYTNPSISIEGSYTQSRENDPDLATPVVKDYYTLGSYTVFVPIFNRWKLSAKQIYFHQKEEDIYPPIGLNYNVYIWGAQIGSEVLILENFKWDLTLRYLGSRGYNNNVFFPFNSKSLFEPGTSIIYSSPWQFAVINSHVESFIIKNFQRSISQLLRTLYIHAGYTLKPQVLLEPRIEVLFDEVFYHDRIRNRRNTLYLNGQFNVIKSYLKFIYQLRQANFRELTENYYTFRRQLRNMIGGVISFTVKDRYSFECIYEHWWKYTAGLVQPIGTLVFADNKQRLQGDKVTLHLGYQLKDKLKVEAIGHLQYTTLPYRDYNVQGRILWQF